MRKNKAQNYFYSQNLVSSSFTDIHKFEYIYTYLHINMYTYILCLYIHTYIFICCMYVCVLCVCMKISD